MQKKPYCFLPVCLLTMMAVSPAACATEDHAVARQQMVETIIERAREIGVYTGRPQLDERVVKAMREVPRHAFVPADQRRRAYVNRPLPIGHEQTISQPLIVALMSDLLRIQPGDRVLEIGTGSGYQAAVLAHMQAEVYSIEIVPELGERAAATLAEQGYEGVHLRIGDGYQGWPDAAPFDAIILTAAPPELPQALIEQLAADGRLVAPVGDQRSGQVLTVYTREPDGSVRAREILDVGFVPMVRPSPAE